MKTILVPVDFSDNAANALIYAINLSEKLSSKVILLHSYYTTHSNVYEKLEKGVPKAEIIANEDLKAFYKKLFPDAKHNVEFISGGDSVVNEIIKQVKEKNVDLIVMATEGLNNRLGRLLLNTNTSLVLEQAPCPVIVMPGNTKDTHNKIEKIVYAAEYIENDILNLKSVAKIASLFRSEIEVVHVAALESETQKILLHDFEQKVKNEVDYAAITFKLLLGDDVEITLGEHLKERETDLLIMSTRHRTLVDKLFERSISKSMALYLSVPLMVFHHGEQ